MEVDKGGKKRGTPAIMSTLKNVIKKIKSLNLNKEIALEDTVTMLIVPKLS